MTDIRTIDWFRHTGPYINSHRDCTFVLHLGSGVLESEHLTNLIHDVALLHSLGVRLVLVHATRGDIDKTLDAAGIAGNFHRDVRITDAVTLDHVKAVNAGQRLALERLLSMGLPNSPMRGARLRVVSGNFVSARPLGVVDGVDFQFTGAVRRIDASGIAGALDQGGIVLLSPLGYSPSGEVFNLASEDLATAAAISLGAAKLIFLDSHEGLFRADGALLRQATVGEARMVAGIDARQEVIRNAACLACEQGVPRTHLISYRVDGALLQELFTHDGAGTLISNLDFEQARAAGSDDIAGVLELVQPLEEAGVLVRRSRELLEQEIDRFRVLERDGRIIACAALYTFDDDRSGELACIATHPDYRNGGRAERLLQIIVDEARTRELEQLFVLTTQTAHWFLEHGFVETSRSALPEARQKLYNLQRNSKVLTRRLR